MHPYGKPPSSATSSATNPGRPSSANGSKPTSPTVPTSQPGVNPRNGASFGGGNELRPSYGMTNDAQRARAREMDDMKANKFHTTSMAASRGGSSSSTTPSSQAHPNYHIHHQRTSTPGSNPPSASSTPREERPNPYGSNPTSSNGTAGATRKPDIMSGSMNSGLGRLGAGYGLFGAGSYREQEYREKERQERLAREREKEREQERERNITKPHPIETSPTHRNTNPSNAYSRPSLPPSPTTTRTLAAPTSANSAGKPSISPQIPPASATSATGSTPRPNLPLPGFGSLGTRSLPSPFERDARERSTSASVAPSPNTASAQDHSSSISGHRRTPSNSSARGHEPGSSLNAAGQKSPVKTTAQTASTARSLYGAPPSLGETLRAREAQRSPVSRIQTAAPPRDRDSAVTPSTATAPKSAASGTSATSSTTPAAGGSQNPRAPYSSYGGFGGPGYPGTFGGFGLGGFGGYGAFGPRWGDRERERETVEQRERREEERKRREKDLAEAKIKAEKEREERDAQWLKARERERERVNSIAKKAYGVEAFQPPRSNPATAGNAAPPAQRTAAADPYRRQPPASTTPAPPANRHIEVIHQPESREFASSAAPGTTTATAGEGSSVIQQVAPSREPRPYGYKAEPREYQYTPRDKRPRMDAAVEDAQNAHRRTSNAKASKRRKEEEKKVDIQNNNHIPLKEKDFSILTNPIKKWPEVSSSQVEKWLKTIPDLNKIISKEIYKGSEWNLSKIGINLNNQENQGGLIIVRINGNFLGKNWKVRGEYGWDDSIPIPPSNNDCFIGGNNKKREIWGTDVYTDDSNLGLILIHAGWLRWSNNSIDSQSQSGVNNKRDQDVINVTIRIVPTLIRYTATERNGIRTRNWGNSHDGSSIVVERVERIDLKTVNVKSRKRKAGISEWARERQLVTPLPITENINKEDTTLLTSPSADQIDNVSLRLCIGLTPDHGIIKLQLGYKYSPEALEGWLDTPERLSKTLWNRRLDLIRMENGIPNRYNIELSPKSNSKSQYITITKDSTNENICYEHPIEDIHFLNEGLAIRLEGNKGLLIKLEMIDWNRGGRSKISEEWKDFLEKDEDEVRDIEDSLERIKREMI